MEPRREEASATDFSGDDTRVAAGSIEDRLAALWADTLEVDAVGPHDDFFALGGNSLLAMQIVAKASRTFGMQIAPSAVFEAPTVAQFAELVLAERAIGPRLARRPHWRRGRRHGKRNLSSQQAAVWLDCTLDPSLMPHVGDTLLLSGSLDVELLEHALTEVVSRHEILRTVFPTSGYSARASVLAPETVRMSQVDLTGKSRSQQNLEIQQLVTQTWSERFAFEEAPPLRVVLARMGRLSNVLILVAHELICDGWSAEVLIQELAHLYNASLDERPVAPLDPAPQYFDLVRAQRLDRPLRTDWSAQISNDAPVGFAYPFELGGFNLDSKGVTEESLELPADLTETLRMTADQETATSFMLYLATFFALLFRCGGGADPVIDIHIAGRPDATFERAIGYFARQVPLYTETDGMQTFPTLLRRVRKSVLELSADSDPKDPPGVVLDGMRRVSRSAIVFRHFDRKHDRPLRFADARVERILPQQTGGHLTMVVSEWRRHQTLVRLMSNPLDSATLKRLLDHYRCLLHSVADNPHAAISELELLSDTERQRLSTGWKKIEVQDDPDLCLHELVATQAQRTPDAVAIRAGSNHVDYATLDDRADRLALHLQERGVQPSALVGVAVPPSVELVVAMLGILKLGAVCMPVASHDPPNAASADALIVSESTSAPSGGAPIVVDLAATSAGADAGRVERDARPERPTDPDRAALVIQTAGATGDPKPVLLDHRAIMHAAARHRDAYRMKGSDRVFHLPASNAPAWTLALWPALAAGAEIVCPVGFPDRDGSQMAGWLGERKVTIATLPAEAAARLLAVKQTRSSSLHTVVVHGQGPISRRANLAVYRQYTLTEAAGYAMSARVHDDETEALVVGDLDTASVNAYVLDGDMKIMPPEGVGELYLAGRGLAQGYFRQPDATEAAFPADPFSEIAGARMVRTGDLARRHADGKIELCGRRCDDARFCGFRLNPMLHKLEVALARNPAVVSAAALWDEVDESIVAYIVPRHKEPLIAHDLDSWVKRTETHYILPSRYIALDRIALRHDGTLDRRALAEAVGRPLRERELTGAQTRAEKKLVSIWKKVLKRHHVGATENFFRIGGDLIVGLEMIARASKAGLSVTIQSLMNTPTIAELAATVDDW